MGSALVMHVAAERKPVPPVIILWSAIVMLVGVRRRAEAFRGWWKSLMRNTEICSRSTWSYTNKHKAALPPHKRESERPDVNSH